MRMFGMFSLMTGAVAFLPACAAAEFQAAAGKIDITPKGPAFLAGYESNRRSAGVHDPLWARCLVLSDGKEMAAIVSCDLIGVGRYHALQIRRLVRAVPGDHVLIGATHTHSGPDTVGMWGPNQLVSGVDKKWMAGVIHGIASLVDETAARLEPASIRFGKIGGIRDASRNIRKPEILDTELTVMQVLGRDGKTTLGALINYACHPETMHSRKITSDFPHWLRETVESKLGGAALYMNGAQGGMVTTVIHNESSYPRGELWPESERVGVLLGEKALEALKKGKTVKNPRIAFERREFTVPLENSGFKLLMKAGVIETGGGPADGVTTEVSRLTVGPADFLTVPGEVLPNIGLRLKSRMKSAYRFQLGLTCDFLGYILTPEDYSEKLYNYEHSMSVGSQMGKLMEENLEFMLSEKPKR